MNTTSASSSVVAAKKAVSRVLAGIRIEMSDELGHYRELIGLLNDGLDEGPYGARSVWIVFQNLYPELQDLDEPESLYPAIYDPIEIDENELLDIHAYEDSDFGQGEAIIHLYHNRLRFVLGLGWHIWNGMRWEADDREASMQFGKIAARIRLRAATHVLENTEGKEAIDAALGRVRNASARRSIPNVTKALKAASTEPSFVTEPKALDRDPFLFGVKNGVVDLVRKELIAPDPTHLITKRSSVMYYPDAPCPRWEQFMMEVFQGDKELVEYVQRCIGYSLTGDTREQCFFMLHGHGANGKSVFTEILRALLGEYGSAVEFKTFMAGEGSSTGNDLAPLRGSRLVVASESEQGKRLNEAVIKQITGGDPLRVRFLFREFFVFMPQFKVWLVTNHKPVIVGTDHGIWRRVRLIPFLAKFEGQAADKELSKKLIAELPGILAWAVRGALSWRDIGLTMPERVSEATQEYRSEMDLLGQFIADRTVSGPHDTARAAVDLFYTNYRSYTEDSGITPLSKPRLARAMKERGYDQVKSSGKFFWTGITIIAQTGF